MKLRLSNLVLLLGVVLLSGCGGGLAGGADDTDPLSPIIEDEFTTDGPRPPESAKVITTDGLTVLDAGGNTVLLRGINLDYATKPDTRVNSIDAIGDTGSNVVRIQLSENTTAAELQAALDQAMLNNMIAMVTLESDKLTCTEDDTFFFQAVNTLWLDRWLPVLAAAEYQPHLMINIANEWGPVNVWNANSIGYDEYIDAYKTAIRRFRSAGFKVPLVIDAPHCGEDYNAFLGNRGRGLLAADDASNLILSVHAFNRHWDSTSEMSFALDKLALEGLPFVFTEFGDSDAHIGAIDQKNLMDSAVGGKAVVFRFPWETTGDKAGYAYQLGSEADFSKGAGISFGIYIDSAYKIDGNLAYQMFLIDATGKYAALGFNTVAGLRANAWTTINLVVDESTEYGSLDTDFDFTRVTQVGFEVAANGKPVSVDGDIKFDNLIVGVDDASASNANALYAATFTDDEGWIKSYGAGDASTVWQESGVLNILAPWESTDGQTSSSQAAVCDLDKLANIDFRQPMRLAVDVFIPAEYDDSSRIQFFFNDATYKYAGVHSSNFAGLTKGVWQTYTYSMSSLAGEAGFISTGFDMTGAVGCAGVEFANINSAKTQPIQIDNFRILPGSATAQKQTIYEATFEYNENWKYAFGAGDQNSLYQYDNTLAILAPWTENSSSTVVSFQSTSTLSPTIDLQAPMTLSMDVYIPEEYASESSLYVEFVITDYSYGNIATFGYSALKDLNVGGWTTLTRNITDVIADAGYIQNKETFIVDEIPKAIGVQVAGIKSAKTAPIQIDNFKLVSESRFVMPETHVVDLAFDDPSEVDAMALSYFGGDAWMASTLIDAKQQGVGVEPFGWIAWSWFGSPDGEAAYDLSASEDTSDSLTSRGEEIVNGVNGIKDTATAVTF